MFKIILFDGLYLKTIWEILCFLYQSYPANEAGADIIFAGTPPGEFEDVKLVKVTIVGQNVKMFNLALEICHEPGIHKYRN